MLTANVTNIQILRSYANTAPTSLLDGQLAYSYVSNTLFIGSNTYGVVAITDQTTANIARQAAANTVYLQGVDNTQNASITAVNQYAQGAYGFANTVYSNYAYPAYVNTLYIAGVDATQNTRLNSIETINSNQNTTIGIIQGVDLTQNTQIQGIQGVDLAQNSAISIIQGVDATQNSWISSNNAIQSGINATQNTQIQGIQGVDNTQNTNISIIQGVDVTQNTWISSNVAYIAGVDAGQNTAITAVNNFAQGAYNQANGANGLAQGAFIKANTPWGYLANGSYTAVLNSSGQFVLPNITTGGYVGGSLVAAGAFVVNANGNLWAYDTNGQLISPYSVKITTGGIAWPDGSLQNTAAASLAYSQAGFGVANSASANSIIIQGVDLTQNTWISSNVAYIAGVDATQNTQIGGIQGVDLTQNTWISSNVGYLQGVNLTQNTSIQNAWNTANVGNTFVYTGGTVSGSVSISKDLTVSGNVNVSGNLTYNYVNSVNIGNSIIYLAANNSANLVDIGIAGHFTGGTKNNYQHTGVVRNHNTGQWVFFSNVTTEPTTTVNFAEANLIYDAIQTGGIFTPTATVNGIELGNYTQLAYNTANSASANSIITQGVDATQNTQIQGIQGVDLAQNSSISIIQGVDLTQNTQIQGIQGVDLAQNAAITIIQGVDNTQNTQIAGIQGVDVTQNTNISVIQGVDLTQNLWIQSAWNAANAGFNLANTLVPSGGWTSNTVFVANTAGYLTNSNMRWDNVQNQLVLGITGAGGNLAIGTTNSTAPLTIQKTYTTPTGGEQYLSWHNINYSSADTNLKQNLRLNTYSGNTSGTISNVLGLLNLTTASGVGGTTTSMYNYWSRADVVLGAYVNNAYNYYVSDNGNTGYANTQYGFYTSNLSRSTVNYGFYGGVNTGANTAYNLYMGGSAPNYFAGSLTIANNVPSTSNTTGGLVVSGGLGVSGNTYLSGNVVVANTSTNLNTLQISPGSYSQETYIGVTNSSTYGSLRFNILPGTGGAGYFFNTYGSATNPGQIQFSVIHSISSVNYLQATGNTTGNGPVLSASGSDTNVDINLQTKGTGKLYVNDGQTTGSLANPVKIVLPGQYSGIAGNTNKIDFYGLNGKYGFGLSVIGSTASMDYVSAGTTYTRHAFFTGNGTPTLQTIILDTPSAVNYLQVTGAVTGGAPYVLANGTDTDVPLILSSKGAGSILFKTAGVTPTQFSVTHTSSAVNYLQVSGNTTSSPVTLSSVGSDANVNINFVTQGSGSFSFLNSNATNGIVITKNIPINEWQVVANNSSNLGLLATGGGSIYFYTSTGGAQRQLAVTPTSLAVNYLTITGNTTTNPVTISAGGSDTNINLLMQPKGNGSVVISSTANTTSNITGAVIVTGGMGITGNVFLSSGNNWSSGTTNANAGYRLGWQDNYFYRTPVYNGVYFNGNFLSVQSSSFIVEGNSNFVLRGGVYTDQASYVTFTSQSGINVQSTLATTSATTGALVVAGGAGISGNVYIGGTLTVAGNTNIQNVNVTQYNITTNDTLYITNTTPTTSNTTGALTVAGGVGIAGNTYITGGTLTLNNGLATTGNSGTIFLGDSSFSKVYGTAFAFNSAIYATNGFVVPNSTYNTAQNAFNFQGGGLGIYLPYVGTIGIMANTANAAMFSAPTGSVNYVQVSGNTTGNPVTISAAGSDANVGINLNPKANASVNIVNSGLYSTLILNTNNYSAYFAKLVASYDTAAPVTLYSGDSDLLLRGGSSAVTTISAPNNGISLAYRGTTQVYVTQPTIGFGVNYLQLSSGSTGNTVIIGSNGSDSNVAISLSPKGTASVMITGNTVGYIPQANSIYVGNRVGFAAANNTSVAYQVYNSLGSIDVVFG